MTTKDAAALALLDAFRKPSGRFGSQPHAAPDGVSLGAPAQETLQIESGNLAPEVLSDIGPVLDLFRASGIPGRLTDLEFDRGNVSGRFETGGVRLAFLASERSLLTSRSVEEKQHLDPEHVNAGDGTFAYSEAQTPEEYRANLLSVIEEARIVDAWSKGSLRSSDDTKFDIPEVQRHTDGTVAIHIDVETKDGPVTVSWDSEGQTLSVLAAGERLWDEDAEAVVQQVAESAGGGLEDMTANLQACAEAAGVRSDLGD